MATKEMATLRMRGERAPTSRFCDGAAFAPAMRRVWRRAACARMILCLYIRRRSGRSPALPCACCCRTRWPNSCARYLPRTAPIPTTFSGAVARSAKAKYRTGKGSLPGSCPRRRTYTPSYSWMRTVARNPLTFICCGTPSPSSTCWLECRSMKFLACSGTPA